MDANHHIWHLGWLHSNCSLFDSMTTLSPAALAVLDAFENASEGEYVEGVWVVNERTMLSAALRAAVDLVVPDKCPPIEDFNEFDQGYAVAHIAHRADFLAIVTELEGL